jgi:putative mRNA 3-end processing factor
MQPFLLENTPSGLYCPAGGFYIDPKRAVAQAVISHAHSDHAVRGHGIVHCTQATAEFMVLKARGAARFRIRPPGAPFRIGGVDVEFLDAGHVLGSVQALLTHRGRRCLYTGDFKLQPDPTCPPYRFAEADELVTESTFADPAVSHPDPAGEIERLNRSEGRNTILAAYSLGKAQRISRLLADHCPSKPVFIHPSIAPFHRIYEKHGFGTGRWLPYSARQFKQAKNAVYIVPPRCFSGYAHDHRYHRAFVSGWKHLQGAGDTAVAISDHADFEGLLRVIRNSGARRVLAVHGDGRPLAAHLAGTGIAMSFLP